MATPRQLRALASTSVYALGVGVRGTERSQALAIGEELEDFVVEHTVRLARRLVGKLDRATPRDTGYLANKWFAVAGGIPSDTSGSRHPTGADVAAAAVRQLASLVALEGYGRNSGPLYVVNDTPYLDYVENGTVHMAGRYFIGPAIEEALSEPF